MRLTRRKITALFSENGIPITGISAISGEGVLEPRFSKENIVLAAAIKPKGFAFSTESIRQMEVNLKSGRKFFVEMHLKGTGYLCDIYRFGTK